VDTFQKLNAVYCVEPLLYLNFALTQSEVLSQSAFNFNYIQTLGIIMTCKCVFLFTKNPCTSKLPTEYIDTIIFLLLSHPPFSRLNEVCWKYADAALTGYAPPLNKALG
jgi:hypothetical protein